MRIAPFAGWIVAAAVVLAAAAGWAQEADEKVTAGTPGHTLEWDGAAVAVVADNLADAVRVARREARAAPRPGVGGGQETGWFLFTDKLRLIRLDAQKIARDARAGKGHDELLENYQRMWILIRDAQDSGKRLAIPKPVEEKIDVVRGLLDQLDAYFD